MTQTKKEIKVTQEVVESITCDFCGLTHYEDDNMCLDNLFASIDWTAGFDSKFDMTNFKLDICGQLPRPEGRSL